MLAYTYERSKPGGTGTYLLKGASAINIIITV